MPAKTLTALRASLADAQAQVADLDDRIAPLIAQRSEAFARVDDITTQIATQVAAQDGPASDAALLALYGSNGTAYREVRDRIDAISPYFYGAQAWRGGTEDPQTFLGPVVIAAAYANTVNPADAPALAAAMVEFAARFCPTQPTGGEFPGMVVASILDEGCGEATDPRIVYTPDGTQASFINARYGITTYATGTLEEVLTVVLTRYQRTENDEDEQ